MSYQVFARKYRPRTFDDIVGQDHIVRTLRNAIGQNRLAHAYLFVGPRGTGKTSTARVLAKALNCTDGPKVDFDPDEDVCAEIAEGRSMDVLEIDGASNNGVEQIRELRENVRFAPTRGKYKIYIVDEVHMLSSGAFNALLKTLEEPPDHVKFIFATTEPQKVLPTILSRCQRFDLKRIPERLIAGHLLHIAENEGVALDGTAADAIAKGADGGLRDAESMLDQLVAFCGESIAEQDVLDVFGFPSQTVVADMAGHLLAARASEALAVLQAQAESGKDLLKLLSDLITHLRNVLVQSVDPGALAADLPADLLASIKDQATLQPAGKIITLIEDLAAAEGRMKWAPNKLLHFEIGLIKASQFLDSASLDDVLETLSAIREGNPPPTRTPSRPTSPPPPAKPAGTPPAQPATPAPEDEGAPSASLSEQVRAALRRTGGDSRTTKTQPPPNTSPPAPTATQTPPPTASATTPADDAPRERPTTRSDRDPAPLGDDSPVAADPESDPSPPPNSTHFPHDSWTALVHSLRESPLIHACLLKFQPLGIEDDTLVLGYHPDQKMNAQMLEDPARARLVTDSLHNILGREIALATRPVDGLMVDPVDAAPVEAEGDPLEEFKNDPLIQKALDLFKGELEQADPRGGPA